jgi:hypothetical protein
MGHGTLSLSRDGGTAKRVNFARHVHVAAEMQRGMRGPRTGLARALHAMILKNLPACSTELLAVLLEALLNGVVAVRHLLSAKPRGVARAGAPLLRSTVWDLRQCIATSQSQRGNC